MKKFLTLISAVFILLSAAESACAEIWLPAGWKQDRSLSGSNRKVFRNNTTQGSLEYDIVPAEGHNAKLIAMALANKANCFRIEDAGNSYVITCDHIDTFTRVAVHNDTAYISTIICHDQATCDSAVEIRKSIDDQ